MAQPTMKTKTERSIYKRLHHKPDEFRSEWHIPERNTKHAREVIARWIEAGILEKQVTTPYPQSSYQKVGYRLAPEWRDDSVVDENLLELQETLDAEAMQVSEQLIRARAQLEESWARSRTLLGGDTLPTDEDLQQATQDALVLINTLRNLNALVKSDARLTERRAQTDAAVAERQLARMDAADPEADPLGGDA